MTWLIWAGAVVVAYLLLVLVNELRVQRRRRDGLRWLEQQPRRREVDVVELDWSEPEDRVRLGRLGQ